MSYSKVLKINGYTPPPTDEDGTQLGVQKIWSENTKRNAACDMVGDIKAIKATLTVSWSRMTQEQLTGLDEAINDLSAQFFPIVYVNQRGQEITKTFYSDSSIVYNRKVYRNNTIIYSDVSINFVEQ